MLTVFRKELKYLLPRKTALFLQRQLSCVMERDAHGQEGRYRIRSQYYDSVWDSDLCDNLAGLFEKRKIRLRIYSLEDQRVKLEYKCKNGADSVKYSMNITKAEALRMENGDISFLTEYDNPLAVRIFYRMMEGAYRPKALIDYERLAFAYPAGDVRITFDTDICGSMTAHGLFETAASNPVSNTEQVLMEVKYTGFLPETIASILKEADLLTTGNSKYSIVRMSGCI